MTNYSHSYRSALELARRIVESSKHAVEFEESAVITRDCLTLAQALCDGPNRPVAPNVDGQDFYELCQQYRHSREIMPHPSLPNTVEAFENLRTYIKTGKLPWPSYEDAQQSATDGSASGPVSKPLEPR